MISVPAGGPDDGQKTVQYIQHVQPATSDAESRGSATTQTCDGIITGDEEPAGLVRSDTEATDPSLDKEIPTIAKAEDQSKPDDFLDERDRTKRDQPKEKTISRESSPCWIA